jgi:tRNA (cmo5U34)-methyltransferase
MDTLESWKFDSKIAINFADYARKHIPNYDKVIDLSVNICKDFSKDAKIVDIGCASGETINRLHTEGFTNIYGVDNSQSMIEVCNQDIATYIFSETFPKNLTNMNVVLMNWTLHFVKNKFDYLQSIFHSLESNGVLILSEKVSLDPYAISKYHQFKRLQGVDEEEILKKEQQVKSVMFIDDTEWYLTKLKEIGFKHIAVINSYWCFNTFLAVK